MTYEEALAELRAVGAGKCSDAAAMAGYCERSLQQIVGAVSPKLVWEGAQRQGMTHLSLANASVHDPMAVHALMWS